MPSTIPIRTAAITIDALSDRPEAGQTRGFTVADLAVRFRVGEEKIRGWIRRGEMRAVNVGATLSGKPRLVVTPEALAEFEKLRTAGPAPKPQARRRRRPQEVDFFPD